MIDLDRYFKVADEVNLIASEYLLSRFGPRKTSSHKTDSHYGIAEDLETNSIYEKFLKEKTPEVALYTEEGERNLQNDLVWTVDPIEGTSNYAAGIPFWATQIALLYKSSPVIAIINIPSLNMKFTAIKDRGAFMNGSPIKPSELKELKLAMIETGRGTKDSDKEWTIKTLDKILKKVRTNRIFGACGIALSFVASGATDLYVSCGNQIYDVLPGTLIAREAGAKVLNEKGEDWELDDKVYIVGNGELVKKLLLELK